MGTTTYAETLAAAQLISAGMRANLDKLAKRGMDAGFIAGMDGSAQKVAELNAEQEALKTRLKVKTSELESALADLKSQISESKKVIKLALDKDYWKEFGVS